MKWTSLVVAPFILNFSLSKNLFVEHEHFLRKIQDLGLEVEKSDKIWGKNRNLKHLHRKFEAVCKKM